MNDRTEAFNEGWAVGVMYVVMRTPSLEDQAHMLRRAMCDSPIAARVLCDNPRFIEWIRDNEQALVEIAVKAGFPADMNEEEE
jgi:hypothetical protein